MHIGIVDIKIDFLEGGDEVVEEAIPFILKYLPEEKINLVVKMTGQSNPHNLFRL